MKSYEIQEYIQDNLEEILETYEAYWDKELNYSDLAKMKLHANRIGFLADYKKYKIDRIYVTLKHESEDEDEL